MDYDLTDLIQYGVDVDTGIEYTGSRDKYIMALKRYLRSYESNRQRITNALAAKDIEDYTIIAHSLKSNSRMIGATELSSSFEALELAARTGNASVIANDTEGVLSRYDALIRQLKSIAADDEADTVEHISSEEARKITEELLDALNEYDDEQSSALAGKLLGYSFDKEKKDILNKAIGLIGEFMYDEAADLIRQLVEAI